jgi:hypothetical protein
MSQMSTTSTAITKSPNRLVATIFGAVFLLIGILGLFVAGDHVVSTEGVSLLGFEVNHLHNIVHIVIGGVLLAAGLKSIPLAKKANATVGAVYFLVGVIGLFIINTSLNILALNAADNVLHFVTAVVLIAVALGTEKNVEPANRAVGTV